MTVTHRIVYTPEARDQLAALHDWIASAADSDTASRFTDGILDQIAVLDSFPNRGTPRDDLRSGLRTLAWRRRVTIAYVVEPADVVIIGIFYAGRDMAALLSEE